MVLESIIAATVVVSLVSLVGILTLPLKDETIQKFIFFIMSFATGTLFGAVFLDLLPEALVSLPAKTAFYAVLAGIMFFFILEKIVHWHHHSRGHTADEKPLAVLNLVGDAAHNFFDGCAIAASFMASPSLGVATTIAVIGHEIPQEIGDYSLLIYSGFSKLKALAFNLLSAFTAVLGAVLFFYYSSVIENGQALGLAFTAGTFIYMAGAGVIPELQKELDSRKSALQAVFMAAGIALIWVICTYLE
ncbi:MAG: ZIP family metal transporter [Candidatus Micrarchaeota archaeon]